MILKDGSHYTVDPSDIAAWNETYTNIDVIQELMAAAAWCDANPSKRKTRTGIKRFINSWLQKADKGGGSPFSSNLKQTTRLATRDMTEMQDLTHNFTGDPAITAYFTEKYGECFEGDSRGISSEGWRNQDGAIGRDDQARRQEKDAGRSQARIAGRGSREGAEQGEIF